VDSKYTRYLVRVCHPEKSVALELWQAMIWLTIQYTIVVTAFNLSFLEPDESIARESESTWAIIVTVFWTLDVAVGFVKPFRDKEGGLRADACAIAGRYCRGFMLVDVLAVAPCIVALFVAGTAHELPPLLQAGGSRIVKTARLRDSTLAKAIAGVVHLTIEGPIELYYRVWKEKSYHYEHSRLWHSVENVTNVVQNLLSFLNVVHVTACLWFVAGYYNTDIATGWVNKQEWDDSVPNATRWLRSFGWAQTTISGFGDNSGNTDSEIVFAAFVSVLGMRCWSTLG